MLVGGERSDGMNRRSTHGCFKSHSLSVQLFLLQREDVVLADAHGSPTGMSFP